MRFYFMILMVLCVFFSCSDKKNTQIDVSTVNIDFTVKRYEVDFYNTTVNTLPDLKNKYPYLFPKSFSDSLAISKIANKDEQELFLETQKLYSDISPLESELTSLFKHVKYYNKNFKAPNLVTMISNIDYNSRVIYADSLLFVSLDVYLGKTHRFYADYPKYIKENNTKKSIIVDVANSMIEKQLVSLPNRSFLSKMIHEGKKLYLLDMYLPAVSDQLKIGYPKEKIDWAIENEENIWKYFIEKKLLFSTETPLNKRFLDNAPFSKFYLQNDNDSPGRIGVWLGWQIVKSFMQNNDVSLQELLMIDFEELFQKSNYKPKK
ncbi:gliding motility lipoprotein GldB [Polaribacter atrinae]|uniref:Gliding motility lipoprotein GldB n=1 Tax=Polaribacter atrinae TaxID=1333662 RepID=A0A176TBS0_9FLAO|nr:gliding motility lipoprotein GldB [Polaribacter atrinae]OAD45284.1 gliding motility lipoprotein GldB [Polaribacter atrinae]